MGPLCAFLFCLFVFLNSTKGFYWLQREVEQEGIRQLWLPGGFIDSVATLQKLCTIFATSFESIIISK